MHNTLYTGDRMEAVNACMNAASLFLGVPVKDLDSHPDFCMIQRAGNKKSLGVEEASELLARAALKPVSAEKTVIVLKDMDCMTIEGQNRLLKTLEDKNYYVLVLASAEEAGKVLDTIKSRMVPIECQRMSKKEFLQLFGDRKDPEMLYWLTNGYPAKADYVESAWELFEQIKLAMEEDNVIKILDSMGMLKEKDESQFDGNIELIKCLFHYLEGYYEYKLVTSYVPKQDAVNITKVAGRIEIVKAERAKLSANYSKNDLFAFVRKAML